MKFLYDFELYKFQFLTSLCGVHFPDNVKEEEYSVVYQLHDLVKNQRIRLKVFTSEVHIQVPSVTPLFSAANWLERETFDFWNSVYGTSEFGENIKHGRPTLFSYAQTVSFRRWNA